MKRVSRSEDCDRNDRILMMIDEHSGVAFDIDIVSISARIRGKACATISV
jgi:hypothetical protein